MDSTSKCYNSKINFDKSVVIGKGAFGTTVYEGRNNKIAVKEVPKNGSFVITGQKAIEDHILPFGKENHPNVVQYFLFDKSIQDFWYLEMEKCDYSLSHFISLPSSISMTMKLKIDLALQMSRGLMYVHEKNLIHKDVKPNNFLLKNISEDKIIIKLADLGFSKRLMDPSSKITSKLDCDALNWVAPELFRPPYHFLSASDVWAFGCVIYFTFSGGKHPFDTPTGKKNLSDRRDNKKNFNLLALEKTDELDQKNTGIQQQLQTLIVAMIDNEPNNRPTIKEVTNQVMQLCNLENKALGNGSSGCNQPRRVGQIEYNDSQVLGEGSYSTFVFEGTFYSVSPFNKKTSKPCAVKRILKDKGGKEIDESNRKKLEEIETLIKLSKGGISSVSNLPIIRCFGFEENNDFWYIACERFEGNLDQFIRGEDPFKARAFCEPNISELQNRKYAIELALQAANGLAFVHRKGYVHKDIKPGNFVIRKGLDKKEQHKWICKLTDLGQTKPLAKGTFVCEPTVRFGTPGWRSPEMEEQIALSADPVNLNKFPFGPKNDVWPMGCVIFFIFFGGLHPYGVGTQIKANICKGKPLDESLNQLSRISQPSFRIDNLVREMIQNDVSKRPEMYKVASSIEKWKLSDKYSASVTPSNIREPKITIPKLINKGGKLGMSIFSMARTIVSSSHRQGSSSSSESDNFANNLIEVSQDLRKIADERSNKNENKSITKGKKKEIY